MFAELEQQPVSAIGGISVDIHVGPDGDAGRSVGAARYRQRLAYSRAGAIGSDQQRGGDLVRPTGRLHLDDAARRGEARAGEASNREGGAALQRVLAQPLVELGAGDHVPDDLAPVDRRKLGVEAYPAGTENGAAGYWILAVGD